MKKGSGTKFKTSGQYVAALPAGPRRMVQQLRRTIKQAAPGAKEVISYNMPSFKLNGMLVYYAGYAKHVGFYPFSSAITAFKDDLKAYETSKGTIRFSLEKPLPLTLIRKIVKFRVAQNADRARRKSKRPA